MTRKAQGGNTKKKTFLIDNVLILTAKKNLPFLKIDCMRKISLLVLFYSVVAFTRCSDQSVKTPAVYTDSIGKIEIYNSLAEKLIDSNATIEIVGRHYKW